MTEAIRAPLNSKHEKQSFYRMVFMLILPIALQNLINTAISSADVVMLNFVSQDALSGVSLATQVTFILNVFFYGVSSGSSVLTAQYWGKRDFATIERIMGIAFRIALIVAAGFGLLSVLTPELLMRIFTTNESMIREGVVYFRVVGVSYLFSAISMMYLNIMRSMERVVLSTVTSVVSLVVNIALNALFIFVFHMGVEGVALATTLARLVEMLVCIIDTRRSKTVKIRVRYIFERNPELTKDFFKYAIPAMINEIAWGTGFSMYTVIISHQDATGNAVAANAIVQTVRNLATVVGFGMANGTSVVIGKALGEGRPEAARVYAKRLLKVTLITGIIGAAIMALLQPFILSFGSDLTETAQGYLGTMMWINVYYVAAMILNCFLICGVFRAGGDAKFGMYCDMLTLWCVFIPLSAFCGFVLKLPVMVVYFIICLDEAFKLPFNIYHYFKSNWARNITRNWD